MANGATTTSTASSTSVSWYGPYASVALALLSVPASARYKGLRVGILTTTLAGNEAAIDWYFKEGITDNDLIPAEQIDISIADITELSNERVLDCQKAGVSYSRFAADLPFTITGVTNLTDDNDFHVMNIERSTANAINMTVPADWLVMGNDDNIAGSQTISLEGVNTASGYTEGIIQLVIQRQSEGASTVYYVTKKIGEAFL